MRNAFFIAAAAFALTVTAQAVVSAVPASDSNGAVQSVGLLL